MIRKSSSINACFCSSTLKTWNCCSLLKLGCVPWQWCSEEIKISHGYLPVLTLFFIFLMWLRKHRFSTDSRLSVLWGPVTLVHLIKACNIFLNIVTLQKVTAQKKNLKNQLILRGSAGRSSLICQCEGVHFYCTTRWRCLLSSHVQTLDSYATDFCCCFFFKMSEIRSIHYLYPSGFLKFVLFLFYFAWFCVIYTNTVQYLTD